MSRVRVAFIHEPYPPYRHELFGLLAQRHEVEFFFVNESPRRLPPRSHVLRGFRIPEMSDFVVAPGLTRAVLRAHEERPFDLILGSDLGSYATLAAFRAARIARRPFVLWSGEWVATRHPRRWLSRPLEALLLPPRPPPRGYPQTPRPPPPYDQPDREHGGLCVRAGRPCASHKNSIRMGHRRT